MLEALAPQWPSYTGFVGDPRARSVQDQGCAACLEPDHRVLVVELFLKPQYAHVEFTHTLHVHYVDKDLVQSSQ